METRLFPFLIDTTSPKMRFLLSGLLILAARADNIHDATADRSLLGKLGTEDEGWYDRMLQFDIGSVPTMLPSQAPSDCAEVIEICPFDSCFLPLTDSSRPAQCAANDQCNMLPQPTGAGCSCCPDECTPENPMFTPSPDGSPPACSPTMMPSAAPTPILPTVVASDPPSAAPSDCAEVID